MIQLQQVTRRYGDFFAVKDVSLEVQAGEIQGFLGVNGAGKTTTLRMICGVLRPTEGKVLVGGYDIEQEPEKAKAITGYIPDRPYIYTKLTAREFLYFVGDLYNVPNDELEDRMDQLVAEYGLTEWQDELVESYSHGMRQRLATVAALIHNPKVLVIDEPMVGLDPHGAKLLKDSMKRYAHEHGMAILLSTHSLNVAEEVADRVAIIDHGEILTTGTVAELHAHSGDTEASDLEKIFLKLTSNTVHTERRIDDSHPV